MVGIISGVSEVDKLREENATLYRLLVEEIERRKLLETLLGKLLSNDSNKPQSRPGLECGPSSDSEKFFTPTGRHARHARRIFDDSRVAVRDLKKTPSESNVRIPLLTRGTRPNVDSRRGDMLRAVSSQSVPTSTQSASVGGCSSFDGRTFSYFVTTDGCVARPKSLQTSLVVGNRTFVERSHMRTQLVKLAATLRSTMAQSRREAVSKAIRGDADLRTVLHTFVHNTRDVTAFSPSGITRETRRRMKKADEYVRKEEALKIGADKMVNRFMAHCYSETVRVSLPVFSK